jgi:DNA polymerase IV
MRSVLFVDPPAFCTTLEGLVAPALRTRPLAIAPPGADRAIILALSSEARVAGVARGMSVRQAQRVCPDLIVLPPNPQLYARASRALHQILRTFAPAIEPRGFGHAFLDLTGTDRLFGPPQDVAYRIRREASQRLRLPLSVGIATNKLVSQAAIRVDRRTDGRSDRELLMVPPGNEQGFLAPQPLEVMPELPSAMRSRLDDYQLSLIGEVANISETALCAVFGRGGRILRARARGIDPRPVLPPERQSEFHLVHTLSTDTNDLTILYPMLRLMSERLGRRLRERGLTAGRLRVEATYTDYTTVTRAVPLQASVLDGELWDAACRAFRMANTRRMAVRAVALTLDRLLETDAQLELWGGGWTDGWADGQVDRWTGGQAGEIRAWATHEISIARPPVHPSTPPAALQHAVDRIRARYGAPALRTGPLTVHRSPLTALYHTTTIFPKVALLSRTRCASAS